MYFLVMKRKDRLFHFLFKEGSDIDEKFIYKCTYYKTVYMIAVWYEFDMKIVWNNDVKLSEYKDIPLM